MTMVVVLRRDRGEGQMDWEDGEEEDIYIRVVAG